MNIMKTIDFSSPENFASHGFPRVYQVKTGYKIFAAVISLWSWGAMIAASYFLASAMRQPGAATSNTEPSAPYLFWVIIIGAASLATFFGFKMASNIWAKLTLNHGDITVSLPFSTRSIRKEEIAGRRIVRQPKGGTLLQLVPVRPGAKPFTFSPAMFKTDAVYDEWINSIPYVDPRQAAQEADLAALKARLAEARGQTETKVASDPAFGATGEERQAYAAKASKSAKRLYVFTGISVALSFVFLQLAIFPLFVLPWIVIRRVARSRGLYRFVADGSGFAVTDMMLIVIVPSLILMGWAMTAFDLLTWLPALLPTALIGLAMFTFELRADSNLKTRRPLWPVFLIPALLYGFSLTLGLNYLFSPAPKSFTASVIDGSVASGGKSSTKSYYLQLTPWGPFSNSRSFSVNSDLYRSVAKGQSVCPRIHPGAFRISFYDVRPCQADTPTTQHAQTSH
jgi:hypothetical protein